MMNLFKKLLPLLVLAGAIFMMSHVPEPEAEARNPNAAGQSINQAQCVLSNPAVTPTADAGTITYGCIPKRYVTITSVEVVPTAVGVGTSQNSKAILMNFGHAGFGPADAGPVAVATCQSNRDGGTAAAFAVGRKFACTLNATAANLNIKPNAMLAEQLHGGSAYGLDTIAAHTPMVISWADEVADGGRSP
jgi:hypothetical protein